jgi:hypothetical protein
MKLLNSEYPASLASTSYRIDPSRNTRIEEYHGKVHLEDLRSVVAALMEDPNWSPDQHALSDLTDAELDLSANDVLRMALTLRQEAKHSTGWKVFAVKDSTSYGVLRMLGYWSRNTERFRIFKSRKEADTWLENHQDKSPPAFHDTLLAPDIQETVTEMREVG